MIDSSGYIAGAMATVLRLEHCRMPKNEFREKRLHYDQACDNFL